MNGHKKAAAAAAFSGGTQLSECMNVVPLQAYVIGIGSGIVDIMP